MTIDELDKKMSTELTAVRSEFAAVRSEFTAVHAEFTAVHAEFTAVRAEMKTLAEGLDARIRAEGETTRRHFDIVAEQFKEHTKVLADGTSRNTERLDDHERRISAIETGRS